MVTHRVQNESIGVSQRLATMMNLRKRSLRATVLAKDFNLRWRGAPVTANATRKWLKGESVPTMDKLAILAAMLDVSADWLRWGEKSMTEQGSDSFARGVSVAISNAQIMERALMQNYRLLSPVHKKLMKAMSEVLLAEQIAAEKERVKK